jgi:adhesin HecA-like repeat protein
VKMPTATTEITLASGRAIQVNDGPEGELLTVRSREGVCVLSVVLTDTGPVLRFEAAALQVVTTHSIDIACQDLRVHAGNKLSLEARSLDLQATQGGITVRAEDDVAIDGERVLLNSADRPQQLSWEQFWSGPGREEKGP